MQRRVFALVGIALLLLCCGCLEQSTGGETLPPINYTKNLPDKPSDFGLVVREMQSQYMDLARLNESYYLQPEFYAKSWEIGQRYYTDHDYSRWAIHGHGAYPGNPSILFTDPIIGNWIRFSTFYRTGWGIETYQGILFVPDQSDFFEVIIEPNEFLLTPTFPIFIEGWVKKINITVGIKVQPPPGVYVIGVRVVDPSEENTEKWFWEVFKKDLSIEQLEMFEECLKQRSTEECEDWILTQRRNKYVGAGNIQVGGRLEIKITVQ